MKLPSLKNANQIRLIITLIYIYLVFFWVPNKFNSLVSIIYIAVMLAMYMNKPTFQEILKNKKKYILFVIIAVLLCINGIISPYGIIEAIKKTIFLFVCYTEFYVLKDSVKDEDKKKNYKIFQKGYTIAITTIFIYFIVNLVVGNTGANVFVWTQMDKNNIAVIMFLFAVLSYKNHYYIGMIISLLFSFLFQSRLILLALLIVVAIEIICTLHKNKKMPNKLTKCIDAILNLDDKGILIILLLSAIVMAVVSYGIVRFVPASSVGEYKKTLNDRSNAMRVRANVLTIETIKNDPMLLLRGYDENTLDVIGVTTEEGIPHSRYLGFRKVQPHNFIMNFCLRFGILYTILYLWILSIILKNYWSKDNISILTAYLFMNVFMHSLLANTFLILFLAVLQIREPKVRKKDQSSIYICHTPYHLLITMMKALHSQITPDLVLAAESANSVLTKDEQLYKRLVKSKMFKNIYIFDVSDEQVDIYKSKFSKIKKYLFMYKASSKLKINLEEYQDVYIFSDRTLFGRIINLKRIYYHLIEDGLDCYIHNKKIVQNQNPVIAFIKYYLFNLNNMAQSIYIIDVEVNQKEGVFLKNRTLIECPRKKMMKILSKEQKQKIAEVFLGKKGIADFHNATLVITQPLSEDKIVEDEKKKISIYKDIINTYKGKGKVIIKTHPREKTNYSKYLKDCIVITKPFPLEIISFFDDMKIKKAVTISSTSINLIENCKDKIYLGWDYIKQKGSENDENAKEK